MDYHDFEKGTISPKSSLNLKRRWHKVPRAIRIYSVFAFLFLMSFVLLYSFTKPLASTPLESDSFAGQRIKSFQQEPSDSLSQSKTQSFAQESGDLKPDFGQQNDDNRNDVKANGMANQNAFDENALKEEDKLTSLSFEVWKSIKLNEQQKKIKAAIKHSWDAYKSYSWGRDHLKPISKSGDDWFGIGLTILDSLDTLLMVGMTDEYDDAMDWVSNSLTFEKNNYVNCFETTIRALGGLLSAYHISGDKILLQKAEDLGSRLIHCFDADRKVPWSDVNLKTRRIKAPSWSSDSSLSEVSSMQIEFRDLSFETGNKTYEEKSFETSKHIHQLVIDRKDPLLPMYISPRTGRLAQGTITMGARADSYYEYLYKQYLQIRERFLLDDWMDAVDMIHDRLLKKTPGKLGLSYIGELFQNDVFSPKMDHLVCFFSGTLALGYYQESKPVQSFHGHVIDSDSTKDKQLDMHLRMSEDLARTCHYMYNLTETGLSPEIGYFGINADEPEYIIRPADTHNLLRPEFVESLFFLYHITGKPVYREWGVQVFDAFEKYSKINSGGYTTLDDVRHPDRTRPKDKMESFWIAETLKYLYLLFTDDKRVIDALLNKYLFNTEGHIVPRRVL